MLLLVITLALVHDVLATKCYDDGWDDYQGSPPGTPPFLAGCAHTRGTAAFVYPEWVESANATQPRGDAYKAFSYPANIVGEVEYWDGGVDNRWIGLDLGGAMPVSMVEVIWSPSMMASSYSLQFALNGPISPAPFHSARKLEGMDNSSLWTSSVPVSLDWASGTNSTPAAAYSLNHTTTVRQYACQPTLAEPDLDMTITATDFSTSYHGFRMARYFRLHIDGLPAHQTSEVARIYQIKVHGMNKQACSTVTNRLAHNLCGSTQIPFGANVAYTMFTADDTAGTRPASTRDRNMCTTANERCGCMVDSSVPGRCFNGVCSTSCYNDVVAPPDPENGVFYCPPVLQHGQSCNITCNPGFRDTGLVDFYPTCMYGFFSPGNATCIGNTYSPSPTPTPTMSLTQHTESSTYSATITASFTTLSSTTSTYTATPTGLNTATATRSATATATATTSPTVRPSEGPTFTGTLLPSFTQTPTMTHTPTMTQSPTATPTPTNWTALAADDNPNPGGPDSSNGDSSIPWPIIIGVAGGTVVTGAALVVLRSRKKNPRIEVAQRRSQIAQGDSDENIELTANPMFLAEHQRMQKELSGGGAGPLDSNNTDNTIAEYGEQDANPLDEYHRQRTMAYDGEKAGGVAAKPGSGAQLSMLMGESDPNMTFSEDDAKEANNLYSEYGGFGLQRSVSINDKQDKLKRLRSSRSAASMQNVGTESSVMSLTTPEELNTTGPPISSPSETQFNAAGDHKTSPQKLPMLGKNISVNASSLDMAGSMFEIVSDPSDAQMMLGGIDEELTDSGRSVAERDEDIGDDIGDQLGVAEAFASTRHALDGVHKNSSPSAGGGAALDDEVDGGAPLWGGWVEYVDESTQKHYYVNKDTNETQWEPPAPRNSGKVAKRHSQFQRDLEKSASNAQLQSGIFTTGASTDATRGLSPGGSALIPPPDLQVTAQDIEADSSDEEAGRGTEGGLRKSSFL